MKDNLNLKILLDHKSSELNKTYLLHNLYHDENEKLDAYWLGTSNPLPNGIEKLPLMVSQWLPVLPQWSNLVQFDFQQKHPGPARDSPLNRESSTKCPHRGWLYIEQLYMWRLVIHQSYNPAENNRKQLRTSENIYGTSKTSDIILRATEKP